MEGLKDKYLLFKAQTFKDADSYGAIYDRYVTRIYRFIYFKVGSQTDAEDITSETFLKAWQYIKESQQVKNLNAFLYSIARNLVIDHYRFQAKKMEFEEVPIAEPQEDNNLPQTLDIKKNEEKILAALKTLKNEYCEVLILRYFDDVPVGDISQIIGKSTGNTRVLIHRALAALKRVVEPQQKNEQ
ncbi:MAG: RNA polymerase sigma factor [Patescibacteria group bacterium]